MECPHCQSPVMDGAAFCHRCGKPLGPVPASPAEGPAAAPPQAGTPGADQPSRDSAAARQPYRDEPEQDRWVSTFSSRSMFGHWILCGLATIVLLVLGVWWRANETWWLLILVTILLMWLYSLLLLVWRRAGVRYRLTSQRFFHEKGILRHVTDRLDVVQIQDISCEQGPIERLWGVGTVRIVSRDRSDPELLLPGIEDAPRVAAMIDEVRRKEQMRRGVLIENPGK